MCAQYGFECFPLLRTRPADIVSALRRGKVGVEQKLLLAAVCARRVDARRVDARRVDRLLGVFGCVLRCAQEAPHEAKVIRDLGGRELRVTMPAAADEIAAASGRVMEKLAAVTATIVRGYPYDRGESSARELVRPFERDLFL